MTTNSRPLIDQVNQKLVERGHRERLLASLIDLLHNSGWYDQTRQTATSVIREQENTYGGATASGVPSTSSTSSTSASDIGKSKSANGGGNDTPTDFEAIFGRVQEQTWGSVPEGVKREMYKEILGVLRQVVGTK